MTREERVALLAVTKIPDRLDAVAAAVTRLAEAVEFAADKAPPGLTMRPKEEG